MSEPFIGQIQSFGFNFAPRSWAQCNGQLLPIAQNQALFSLLGTIYGGDGRTTFGLPDLRGRVPMHEGKGSGLTDRKLGHKFGQEKVAQAADEKGEGESQASTPPVLVLNWCIALHGIYPSRS